MHFNLLVTFRLLVVGLGLCPLMVAAEQQARFDIPFLTVREPVTPSGNRPFFGDGRSALRAGWCRVQAVDTGGFQSLVDAGPSFIKEQLVQIEEVQVLPPSDLYSSLQESWTKSPALYVHGYFIDFEKGCRRATLFHENAALGERLVWFTWPSDGDLADYTPDEVDLYWSVPDIADAVIQLSQHSSDPIDVVGHSLGARGVALALYEVSFRQPDVRLGQVVLIAADMDFGIFARKLPRIATLAEGITVYISDGDTPLSISEQLHGYRRLGQSGNDVSSLSGVEVIDVSDVPKENASGHLYHIHNEAVGQDIDRLLNQRMRAGARKGLVQTGPNLWHLRP